MPVAAGEHRNPGAAATYGSDKAGLVCGYMFEGGTASPVDGDGAARHLSEWDGSARSFFWLHFNLTNAASELWLRRHLKLPETFYDSRRESPSTRVESVGDALIAVVHDLQFFGAEKASASSVLLFVDQKVMVSARTTPVRAADRLRTAVKAGESFDSPVGLLAHLLRDQADVLVDVVRDTAKQVDEIEDTLLERRVSVSRPRLGKLRRGLVRLQRVLAPEPAALFRLLNRPPAWMRDADVADLRRSAEEFAVALADSTALIERMRNLQDELSAQLDEATNRTLYILTILTAIAAPFEFISQLFGMGVGGVPFHDNPHGFFIVFVLILVVIGLGTILVKKLIVRS